MFNLFNSRTSLNVSQIMPKQWPNAKGVLKRNLATVINFYHSHSMAVASDHFLVRLLQSINVPQSLETDRYYDNVVDVSMNLSMALKMTSSYYQGKVFDGVFYGQGNTEVLVSVETEFNPYEATQLWTRLMPVQVLRHPRSDMALNLPNGRNTGSESGIAVITINIPMLAIMYRAFRLNEMKAHEKDGDSQRSLMMFVHMYVLPNMLPTHLDYAIFNRFMCFSNGNPLGDSLQRHSFYTIKEIGVLDTALKSLVTYFEKTRISFTAVLRNIPCINKQNLDYALMLPEVAYTRQIIWALALARIPVIMELVRIANATNSKMNREDFNAIAKFLALVRNDKLMPNALPEHVMREVRKDLDTLKEMINA